MYLIIIIDSVHENSLKCVIFILKQKKKIIKYQIRKTNRCIVHPSTGLINKLINKLNIQVF